MVPPVMRSRRGGLCERVRSTSSGKGIGNVELAYYDSRKDRSGCDPFVRNSEFRLLVGYEQEVAKDFTAGIQYYRSLCWTTATTGARSPRTSPSPMSTTMSSPFG